MSETNPNAIASSTTASSRNISSANPLSRLGRFNQQAALLGLFFVAFFFTYSSAIFLVYGFNDDYGLMDQAIAWPAGSIYHGMAVQGRVIFGLIIEYFFTHIHNLHRLWELRAVSIAGLAMSAWMLHWMLRRNRWSAWTAASIGIIACTLPPEQVFACWATFVPVPWAMLCAIGAGLMAGWIFDLGGRWWVMAPLVVALLWITSITYQPSTMVMIPMMVVSAFSPRNREEPTRRMLKRLGFFFSVFFAALAGGLLVFKWGMKKYPDMDVAGRMGMSFDWHDKPAWFVKHVMVNGLNLWVMPADPWNAIFIGAFVLTGLILYFRGGWGQRALRIGICILCLPLSYLVNLLAEDALAYRTLIAMDWTILLLALCALAGYWKTVARFGDGELRESIQRWFLTAATVCACGYAGYWSTVELTWPRAVELADLRLQLSKPEATGVRHFMVLTMQNWSDFPAPYWPSDEFGSPSIANEMDWESQGAIFMVQREKDARLHINPSVQLVKQFQGDKPPATRPGEIVIDMRRLAGTR